MKPFVALLAASLLSVRAIAQSLEFNTYSDDECNNYLDGTYECTGTDCTEVKFPGPLPIAIGIVDAPWWCSLFLYSGDDYEGTEGWVSSSYEYDNYCISLTNGVPIESLQIYCAR